MPIGSKRSVRGGHLVVKPVAGAPVITANTAADANKMRTKTPRVLRIRRAHAGVGVLVASITRNGPRVKAVRSVAPQSLMNAHSQMKMSRPKKTDSNPDGSRVGIGDSTQRTAEIAMATRGIRI
jgi:hypothetical protein